MASDLHPPAAPAAPFVPADVRTGEGLTEALTGADVLVHLPAWHGIHTGSRTESEFWELNVDGTFRALQACLAAGVRKVVWLSSQAVHDRHGTYGFTKVLGEQLLEYHRIRHGISYIAVRPASLIPWADWANDYGRGLLYDRVDREDALDAIQLSIDYIETHDAGLIVDALHPDVLSDRDLEDWERDPLATAERRFPGARSAVERFGLDISAPPTRPTTQGWSEIGFTPSRHFGTWVAEAAALTDEEARSRKSDY